MWCQEGKFPGQSEAHFNDGSREESQGGVWMALEKLEAQNPKP